LGDPEPSHRATTAVGPDSRQLPDGSGVTELTAFARIWREPGNWLWRRLCTCLSRGGGADERESVAGAGGQGAGGDPAAAGRRPRRRERPPPARSRPGGGGSPGGRTSAPA